MTQIISIFEQAWLLLLDSAVYILFGLLAAGLLRAFVSPALVSRHLGRGRFGPVFKAALLGIPIPLCSCGVLPAAAGLKKQGANNGAVTSFLIATPESGVDSIALTYALLDPIMTVARPLAAFVTAVAAGLAQNLGRNGEADRPVRADLSCPVDNCCDGIDCPPEVHRRHHSFYQRVRVGLGFAYGELWADLAVWFFVGLILAGAVTALVPQEFMVAHLGGGLTSMLLILAVAAPMYVCATASTPIAAALILKGVSPGAALVFLLAGPATNAASLTVLAKLLGKRAMIIYLVAIAVVSVAAGLTLDAVYAAWGVSAVALAGQAGEMIPGWLQLLAGLILLAMSAKPIGLAVKRRWARLTGRPEPGPACGCGCDQDHDSKSTKVHEHRPPGGAELFPIASDPGGAGKAG